MASIISYNTTAALSFSDNRFSKPFILNNHPSSSSSVFYTGAKNFVTERESCNGFSSGRSFFSGELKRSSLPKYSEKWGSVVGGVRSSKNDNAFAVESAEYVVEPSTNVKFQTSLNLPGCSDSLVLIGTGYREKVFAIIGVKVYAAGFYANKSVMEKLESWKGKTSAEIEGDSSLYDTIFQAPMEKSLQIVLVRDVDGKTFWDALNEAISPRIKAPSPVDESALSTFRSTFEGRPLKKGTLIFLTWVDPSKMLVCISSDGLPSTVDATTESKNVSLAFFDVFFGDTPVSPSLKTSVSNRLAGVLN